MELNYGIQVFQCYQGILYQMWTEMALALLTLAQVPSSVIQFNIAMEQGLLYTNQDIIE